MFSKSEKSDAFGRARSLFVSAEIVAPTNVDGRTAEISTSPKNFFSSVFSSVSAAAFVGMTELALIVIP